MKREILISILLFFCTDCYCQLGNPQLSIRISLQSDFQKANFKDTQFPFEYKEHSASQINWGIDVLAGKEIFKKWHGYIGVGYFKNKFNFKRAYDHTLLNPINDSIPLGTSTSNYTYNLIRFPIGLSYRLVSKNKIAVNLGIEGIINFSFSQVYNGTKPFPDANNRLKKFDFFGNSLLLFGQITSEITKKKHLQIEPYIRVLNLSKGKNPILYESTSKTISKTFDAIGISINYSFNL